MGMNASFRNVTVSFVVSLLIGLISNGIIYAQNFGPERYVSGEIIVLNLNQAFKASKPYAEIRGNYTSEWKKLSANNEVQLWKIPVGNEKLIVEQINASNNGLRALLNYNFEADFANEELLSTPNAIKKSSNELSTFPNDPKFQWQMHLHNTGNFASAKYDADIDAPEAWDHATGSKSVIVAVIESGFDIYHEDLRDNLWVNPNEIPNNGIDDDGNGFIDDVNGWNAVNYNANVYTTDWHSTGVAGVIGARGNNAKGISGVAQSVSLMPVRVATNGYFELGDIFNGYNYITKMLQAGHNIVAANQSFGFEFGTDLYSRDMVEAFKFYADQHGSYNCIWVVSSGNDGKNLDTSTRYRIPTITQSPNVITVGGTNEQDNFSTDKNYGAQLVDIAALSEWVFTTDAGNDYTYRVGTSFAAPQVAGLVALGASRFTDEHFSARIARIFAGGDEISNFSLYSNSGKRINAYQSIATDQLRKPLQPALEVFKGSFKSIDAQINVSVGFVNQTGSSITVSRMYLQGPNAQQFSISSSTAIGNLPNGHAFGAAIRVTRNNSLSSYQVNLIVETSAGLVNHPIQIDMPSGPNISVIPTADTLRGVDPDQQMLTHSFLLANYGTQTLNYNESLIIYDITNKETPFKLAEISPQMLQNEGIRIEDAGSIAPQMDETRTMYLPGSMMEAGKTYLYQSNYSSNAVNNPQGLGTGNARYSLRISTMDALTIQGSFTVENKTYDGTTQAVVSSSNLTLAGLQNGADVQVQRIEAAFLNEKAGSDKEVRITNVFLSGADAADYHVSLAGAPSTIADITQKPIQITGDFAVADKAYDGTTIAEITDATALTLVGVLNDDQVILDSNSLEALFDAPNVAEDVMVRLSSASLAGSDHQNYQIDSQNMPTSSGTIYKEIQLSGTWQASDKTYDATTEASILRSDQLQILGALDGDVIQVQSLNIAFSDSAAGTNKEVFIQEVILSGDYQAYRLNPSYPVAYATIEPKPLHIVGNFSASDKVYDASQQAMLIQPYSLRIDSVLSGDQVEIDLQNLELTFSNSGPGLNIPVSITDATLIGLQAPNYILDLSNAPQTVANIKQSLQLSGSFQVHNKVYDATTNAALKVNDVSIQGVLEGHSVELDSLVVAFESANASNQAKAHIQKATLKGPDSELYLLSNTAIITTAEIYPASLQIAAISDTIEYTAEPFNGGFGFLSDGWVEAEGPMNLDGEAVYGGEAQGATLPGTYSLSVRGLSNPNYSIEWQDGWLTIEASNLHVSYVIPSPSEQAAYPSSPIQVNFSESIRLNNQNAIQVWVNGDQRTIRDLVLTNQRVSFYADLNYNEPVEVLIKEGAVLSEIDQPNQAYEWSFRTRNSAPVLESVQTANGDTLIVPGQPLIVYFDQPIKLNLHDRIHFRRMEDGCTLYPSSISMRTGTDNQLQMSTNVLEEGQNYEFVLPTASVVNMHNSQNIPQSLSFSTRLTAPNSVPNLIGVQGQLNTLNPEFSWSLVPKAEWYELNVYELKKVGSIQFRTLVVDTTLENNHVHLNGTFKRDMSYEWCVRAANSGGTGNWSSVRSFTIVIPTSITDAYTNLPLTFQLAPNYPNPFNPTTTLNVGLESAVKNLKINVYAINGNIQSQYNLGSMAAGWHQWQLSIGQWPSGVYLVEVWADNQVRYQKITLLK